MAVSYSTNAERAGWTAIGIGAVVMLFVTDVLPIGLLGESLFDGIDHFALIAVPLFILTGDVLVRTGLSDKLLDVADATTGGFRAGLGIAELCIGGSGGSEKGQTVILGHLSHGGGHQAHFHGTV